MQIRTDRVRLCRLMSGRSMTFRKWPSGLPGLRPPLGRSPEVEGYPSTVGHSHHRTSGGKGATNEEPSIAEHDDRRSPITEC